MNSEPVVIVSAARTPIGKSFKDPWRNAWQFQWDVSIASLFTLLRDELCWCANSELNLFSTVVVILIIYVCYFWNDFNSSRLLNLTGRLIFIQKTQSRTELWLVHWLVRESLQAFIGYFLIVPQGTRCALLVTCNSSLGVFMCSRIWTDDVLNFFLTAFI